MTNAHDAHDVLIAGGGPTGLMLAAELALAGVHVAVVERRTTQEFAGSRARGLHARSIEVLDQRGVADRFVSAGQTYPAVNFHVPLVVSDFPTRHNYLLGLLQKHVERLLAEWVATLPVVFHRGRELTGFTQDDEGVDVALADGATLRARYLVGCDGGRSIVRKTAGIEFPGFDPTTSWLIAEARTTGTPPFGFHQDARGMHAIGPGEEPGYVGFVLVEERVGSGEPTLDVVRRALVDVYGTDFGIHDPRWVSRFTDMTRQAARYRDRRVLLAGDAAHVHAPLGGQGLNLGLQDAVNLGWKLAQVVRGITPDTLLDTYHAERHPVAARALRSTMALAALRRPDEHSKALGEYFAELMAMDEPRKHLAAEVTGLGIRYEMSDAQPNGALPDDPQPADAHPLLGRRMPDLDLATDDGTVRVFELLHEARPLLIEFEGAARAPAQVARAADVARSWSDRVRIVRARYDGAWVLPAIGVVDAPAAVVVRPDGYVAWVGEGTDTGLEGALTRWFGPASRS